MDRDNDWRDLHRSAIHDVATHMAELLEASLTPFAQSIKRCRSPGPALYTEAIFWHSDAIVRLLSPFLCDGNDGGSDANLFS
jgi:hypothetical protein